MVSNLALNPTNVYVGEKVIISVLVTNIGDETGLYTVSLKIGQVVEDSKTVMLKGGQSATVTFSVTKSVPGTYTVAVGDLTSEFMVLALPTFPFLEFIVASFAAAGIFLFLLLKRSKRPDVKKS